MTCLVFTPTLSRASRSAFNTLARFLASCCNAPAWVTAATQIAGPYVGRALRWQGWLACLQGFILQFRSPQTDPSTYSRKKNVG